MKDELDILLKIVLAFVGGVIIGWNRERSGKVAGIRTQMLVCVGSALLTGISIHIVDIVGMGADFKADPARLMAQIVSGIGFLGAGVILKNGDRIVGVTTAATIWVSAAVGIAIGTGFYVSALLTICLVLLLDPIGHWQYQFGFKGKDYILRVKKSRRAVTQKAVEWSGVAAKEVVGENGDVDFVIHSSEQKNMELERLLGQLRVKYSLVEKVTD